MSVPVPTFPVSALIRSWRSASANGVIITGHEAATRNHTLDSFAGPRAIRNAGVCFEALRKT